MTEDAAFTAELIEYLQARGYRVTKARAPRSTGTARLRKAHMAGAHRTDSEAGCPLCAFRADVRTHAAHRTREDACRFCTYEQRDRIHPSRLRRLPEQGRYDRAYRLWQRARRHYGAGSVRTDHRGLRPQIAAHPRLARLEALLDRLSHPELRHAA